MCWGNNNKDFRHGFCGWNSHYPDQYERPVDAGSVVSVLPPGWEWPGASEASYAWTGRAGISQPWAICRNDDLCYAMITARTAATQCGFQLCFWKDLDDPAQYLCMDGKSPTDYTFITADDGWVGKMVRMPGGRQLVGQRGWTFSLFVNNCDLYVSYLGWVGCDQK